MPQAFKVVGKPHRRASMQAMETVITPDGRSVQIMQNGPMANYAVGDIIEDITLAELEAFPDRFAVATEAEVRAFRARPRLAPRMQAPGLTAQQAEQNAELSRQIAALQAQQQDLLNAAQTPVPVQVDEEGLPERIPASARTAVSRAAQERAAQERAMQEQAAAAEKAAAEQAAAQRKA